MRLFESKVSKRLEEADSLDVSQKIDVLPTMHMWGEDAVTSTSSIFKNKATSKVKDWITKFFIKRFNVKSPNQVKLDKRDSLWDDAETKTVDVKNIIPSQDYINKTELKKKLEYTDKNTPLGVAIAGSDKVVLFNGHHRVALDILKGKTSIPIKIVTSYHTFK